MPRVVDSARDDRPDGGRRDPLGHRQRASSAPRLSRTTRSSRADRWPRAAITARCVSKARNTSSPTATSSTSATPPDAPHAAMSIRTVVVCEAQVPFVEGGAEYHVRELVAQLRARGYQTELVASRSSGIRRTRSWRTPRRGGCSTSARATAGRSTWSSARNSRRISSAIRNKVAWLIHQYRAAYELCGTDYSDFDHVEGDVGAARPR